ncbi:MAG TPA: hypothetical protein VJT09_07900, partial [Pyrinomonadaceae bacterium]|nr:hypothetical protein [Pyrinomonadaceae bacterium]
AESYRHLIAVANEQEVDDETWLAYADALRLAERVEEARTVYQRISSSASLPAAQVARQRLAELGPIVAASPGSNGTERPRDERAGQETAVPSASPTPLAQATPVPTPATNPPQADADAYYFKAMNIVNGRDPKKLSDGELAAALNYFLRAQSSPQHGAEARRYAERIGREYDRRRKR